MPAIAIDKRQLGTLFPAFIEIDRALAVRSVGPFFRRRKTTVAAGALLPDLFSLGNAAAALAAGEDSPAAMARVIADLAESADRIDLFCRTKGIRLAGMVVPLDDGFMLTMNLLPADYVLDGQNLTFDDFSPYDAAAPALLLVGMQRALLAEARETAVELAQAQAEAVDLLDSVQRLGRYIAHDLNNYLSIISLNATRLGLSPNRDDEDRRHLAAITTASREIADLTLSLQRYSGQPKTATNPIALDEVIASNLAFLATLLPPSITLDFAAGAQGACVRTGRTELISCLTNLIINARDAMHTGGSITITTGQCGDRLMVGVTDTGPGMAPDIAARAFEPYFSSRPGRPGLGLPSVRDYARAIGGEVRLVTAPGAGTRVELTLPHCPAAPRPDNAASAPARVLVVEDEPAALEAMVELLQHSGHQVTAASGAAAAMQAVADTEFDVVLSDIVMPDGSGVDIAAQIADACPATAIILMSGYCPDPAQIAPGWQLLNKPIDLARLDEAIASALRAGPVPA